MSITCIHHTHSHTHTRTHTHTHTDTNTHTHTHKHTHTVSYHSLHSIHNQPPAIIHRSVWARYLGRISSSTHCKVYILYVLLLLLAVQQLATFHIHTSAKEQDSKSKCSSTCGMEGLAGTRQTLYHFLR